MEALRKIFKDKFALSAFVVLAFLYLVILFADFIAPYTNTYSNRDMSYSPPSKIYTITEDGKFSFPYTYNYVREYEPALMQTIYKQDRSKKYYIKPFVKGEKYKFLGIIPCDRHLFGAVANNTPLLEDSGMGEVSTNGNLYLLGTDINGRDVFSRLLFGGRISMTVGFLSLFVVFPIGLLYGGISGYFGGVIDILMMRFAEAVMAIPSFYLLIILAAILPSGMTSVQRFGLIIVILALIGWAGFARVVRGMVLSIKKEDFVLAEKTIGASSLRIILKHILPQTTSYVIIAMTLSVPSYILAESGLSFLGLGIQQPDASWGNMLKEAQEFTNILYRPWLLAPGGLIFLAVLSFNLLGDAIRDYLDPKSKIEV